jgi:hypothetical protein
LLFVKSTARITSDDSNPAVRSSRRTSSIVLKRSGIRSKLKRELLPSSLALLERFMLNFLKNPILQQRIRSSTSRNHYHVVNEIQRSAMPARSLKAAQGTTRQMT